MSNNATNNANTTKRISCAVGHYLDFYPIVFAGGTGSRLHPLTDELIKALLPVGNKPALFSSLYMLERSGNNKNRLFIIALVSLTRMN
jgi:mannose-1-phosphate guanylyltransferase